VEVPFFNLKRQVEPLLPQIEARWKILTDSTAFVGGEEVARFENAFGEYLDGVECVGVANGTDALILALRALGVGPGDEVLVPAFSFIATASAVVLAGGVPVFVDVEEDTLNIDPTAVWAKRSDRTVGLIGVHLYGRPFDLTAVRQICDEEGIWMIEDAAQAHGARWKGRRVGTFGSLATWSFYPSKNLGCFGDGGAVTGSDRDLLSRVRLLADHGRRGHYEHSDIGTNSRLDAIQAAVLNVRLEQLEDDNQSRRSHAQRYRDELERIGDLKLLSDPPESEPVYHQMTILSPRRDALQCHMKNCDIGTAVHYPRALSQQSALSAYATTSCPVAEQAGETVLCLPVFPQLDEVEIDAVVGAIRKFY